MAQEKGPSEEKKLTKDKKLILLIAGTAFVFLLLGSLYFYFYVQAAKGPQVSTTPKPPQDRTGASSSKTEEKKKAAQKSASKQVNPSATAKPQPGGQDQEAFSSYEYKDPFQPLLGAEASPPASTQTTETQNQRLGLEDITEESGVKFASVKYGGVAYKVKEGDRVDESPYQVISIGDNSTTLLYGDEQVSVQLGQEIIK